MGWLKLPWILSAPYGFLLLLLWWPDVKGTPCGLPGRPVDGWYVPVNQQQIYPSGSEIQYFCDPKQLLVGPSKRFCLSDGTWSGNIPLCKKPVKVQSALQSTILDENNAMKALDRSYSTCATSEYQAEAHWTAFLTNVSIVMAIRLSLPLGDNADLEVLVKKEGSLPVRCGRYTGNTGMKQITMVFYCPPNTEGLLVHIQDYTKTKHYFQLCEVEIFVQRNNPCLNPDIPSNGYGNKRSSGSDTAFRYFCSQGYVLDGPPEAICLPNGTWSPRAPTCEPITCQPPPTLQSGSVTYEAIGGKVPYGGTASYTCNPSFMIQGDVTRQCLKKNQWSGHPPVCVAAECDSSLPSVLHGRLTVNSTFVRSEALLQCVKGYRVWGADRLVCLPSGRWSSDTLMCVPIQCEEIHTIPHGTLQMLDESTFYGSHLQVICDSGYTIRGDPLKRCLENGSWESLSDACIETFCEIPALGAPFEGGNWVSMSGASRPKPGAVMMLQCDPDFEITGTPHIITCLPNGTWTPRSAACIQISTAEATRDRWRNDWSPSTMMVAAISVGAGTAVCILCIVSAVLMIRKRHQPQSNTTVFHVGIPDGSSSYKEYMTSPEEHYYTTALYEEVPEPAVNPPIKPRKPCSPLPPPPLEAEPFYSQPFEVGSSGPSKKCSASQKEVGDTGHIYAEPVDTCCSLYERRNKSSVQGNTPDQQKDIKGFNVSDGGQPTNQPDDIYEKLGDSFQSQITLNETQENISFTIKISNKPLILQNMCPNVKDNSIYATSSHNNVSCDTMKRNSIEVKMVENTMFWSDSDTDL